MNVECRRDEDKEVRESTIDAIALIGGEQANKAYEKALAEGGKTKSRGQRDHRKV